MGGVYAVLPGEIPPAPFAIWNNSHKGERDIARRPSRFSREPQREGPKANEEIEATEVQLIDATGENVGVVDRDEAIEQAYAAGLDLVEISPSAKPPVCKILDHGKFKFQAQKKAAEARKKQKTFDVKEIKMRPNIDTHDYDVKMRNMNKFFNQGDKVKVTIRFRGREMAHKELGFDLLNRVKGDTEEIAKVEAQPKLEGRQMMMVLAPIK